MAVQSYIDPFFFILKAHTCDTSETVNRRFGGGTDDVFDLLQVYNTPINFDQLDIDVNDLIFLVFRLSSTYSCKLLIIIKK